MLFRLFTMLAVMALAVSTWILSSPAHRPVSVAAAAAKADLPGYYFTHALLTEFDAAGAPGVRLEAERIDQIDHGSEVALTTVRVDYEPPNGQNWVIVGDTGRVETGGNIIDLQGHVLLTGTAIVHTDTLRYDVPDSIVTTPDEVHVQFGEHTLSARGLKANLKERTMHLESKVNGRFLR